MSLRNAGVTADETTRVSVTFRCPPKLKQYIDQASEAPDRNKTEVITSALELDRGLEEELRVDEERIAAFAKAHELVAHKDLPATLARLVRIGLDSWERGERGQARMKKARTR